LYNNRILKAFTVIELVMSIFMMSFIAVLALSIVPKKDKVPKKVASLENSMSMCHVGTRAGGHINVAGMDKDKRAGCYRPVSYRNVDRTKGVVIGNLYDKVNYLEFIQIKLIGAGARGGKIDGVEYCAGAGQEKTVIFPALSMPYPRSQENKERKCASPMCEECDNNDNCTKCVKGYALVNNVCEPDFQYQSVIGLTPAEPGNGGATYYMVCEHNKAGNPKNCEVIESALGGTIYKKPAGMDKCPDEFPSSDIRSGSAINEGYVPEPGEDNPGMGDVMLMF